MGKKSFNKLSKIYFICLFSGVAIVAFQNCAQTFQTNSTVEASSTPVSEVPIAFQTTRIVHSIAGETLIPYGTCSHYTVDGTAMQLCMQTSGNLVLYNSANVAVWASNWYTYLDFGGYTGTTIFSSGCPGCYAKFQSAGNLVLYNGSNAPYWASGTGGLSAGTVLAISNTWPYLSINSASGTPLQVFPYSPSSYAVPMPSNNAAAWDQIQPPAPGGTDYFLGRQCLSPDCGAACAQAYCPATSKTAADTKAMTLVVAKMNWVTHTLSVVNQNLFAGNNQIGNCSAGKCFKISGNYSIVTAYDPSALYAHGELWVAFECSDWNATGIAGAGSCMGPVVMPNPSNPATWYINAARTTVVVKPNYYNPAVSVNTCVTTKTSSNLGQASECYSASEPKLFFWHGLPYMYYTTVQSKPGGSWFGGGTRGIELQLTNITGTGTFWANGSLNRSIYAVDAPNGPVHSYEVMQVDSSDPLSNQWADGSGVYPQGPAGAETSLIMTGALGGSSNVSCTLPGGLNTTTSNGCYRQFIARATEPLGTGIFNEWRVSETEDYMPANLSQYARHFTDNNGQSMIWGAYSPSTQTSDPFNQWLVPSSISMTAYPVNFSTLNFQPTTVTYSAGKFTLTPGEQINLANGFMVYQAQGNLVLYNAYGTYLWTSSLAPGGCAGANCELIFQQAGNLVQYRNSVYYWASSTSGYGAVSLKFGIHPLETGSQPYHYIETLNSAGVPVWGQ